MGEKSDEDPSKHESPVIEEHQLVAESDPSDTKKSGEESSDSEAKDIYAASASNTVSGSHDNQAEETQEGAVSREGGSKLASEMRKSNP